jgi:HPt (histidine-containing phosphotransfer) domain-containing protein
MKVLDRAGHIAPTRKDLAPRQKALSEMSRDELAAFIEQNQAEIDKVEGELASRATDVSPYL